MMLDLKSGYLVGALPRKQQIAQFIGAWLGPIIIIYLIFALHGQYTLGSDKLPAPQGEALASMIQGVVGEDVPTYRYMAGAGLGGMLASLSAGEAFNVSSSGRMTRYIIGWILNLPLAIYFICGAPHFVRWQVRKTLEFAEKGDEDIKD